MLNRLHVAAATILFAYKRTKCEPDVAIWSLDRFMPRSSSGAVLEPIL
jgi:hypothetical protein